jgi:pimeloyl-ACP methyl ester carboxylesterase
VRIVESATGSIRVLDTGASGKPCVLVVPDGPNVIEHDEHLSALPVRDCRLVCFDMPGFGLSLPSSSYRHSLDQGARAVLELPSRHPGAVTARLRGARGNHSF